MHYKKIEINETSDLLEPVITCLVDAWAPAWHALFSDDDVRSAVSKLLMVPTSEFSHDHVKALQRKDRVVGLTLALDLAKVSAARQVNIFNILSQVDDKMAFMAKLPAYNAMFPNLPDENGIYLSKFCVASDIRGQGVGHDLMKHFLEHDVGQSSAFLEVHADNFAAIALYEHYSFKRVCDGKADYILMKRTQ